MKNSFRLADGGVIDRTRPVNFIFNGKEYQGLHGDTLASALLANGVHWVGRSFKTHRPRGIMAADVSEPNAIVQSAKGNINSFPNMQASEIVLIEGLRVKSVNVWPNLYLDIAAINQYFSKYLIAGFYYKTFLWPKYFWKNVYEPIIRKMAGFGVCDLSVDKRSYDKADIFCEVLIVGAGPAGLAAAENLAEQANTRVIIVDSNFEFGNSLLGSDNYQWAQQVTEKILDNPNFTLLRQTTVFGIYEKNYLCARQIKADGQRIWHIHAKRVILATGAHERPLVFRNNDRPGVMLASAANRYLLQYGVACGQEVVFFTNNDSVYPIVRNFLQYKVKVKAIVDIRPDASITGVDAPMYTSRKVVAVHGKKRVKAVKLDNGALINCDLLLVSGGWSPAVHLYSQAGGKLDYCEVRNCFIPDLQLANIQSIGSCNGTFILDNCFNEAKNVLAEKPLEPVDKLQVSALWNVKANINDTGKANIIDFAEDVSFADIQHAALEGMDSIELIKRYTTAGMGMEQGKIANLNVIGNLSMVLQKPIADVGTTKFRPPYTPVTFAALAGVERDELFDPVRVTTLHAKHVELGAKFENVGQWLRPWYYPKVNESMHDCLQRESMAVHNSIGILDGSTLGKIDIQGPDAGKFLDLVYTNNFSNLKVGACRYGIMCKEDGMVFDDGITARLAENHYYMTTTTGGAAHVLDWLEFWLQIQYPELEVYLTSVTEQFGALVVSGPNSRKLMCEVFPEQDFASSEFPFMQIRRAEILGVPVNLLRISFTGELSYEIHYPAHSGAKIWHIIMQAGAKYSITPYGTETMHILRAEKGFIIVGQDTDGTVTPNDLNMQWIVSKKKDFLGKRSLQLVNNVREDRKILVGLETVNSQEVLPEGAQLVKDPKTPKPIPMDGHVTSSYYSAILNKSIALALIKNGNNRHGEKLFAPIGKRIIEVKIVAPVFYDPQGARQNVD